MMSRSRIFAVVTVLITIRPAPIAETVALTSAMPSIATSQAYFGTFIQRINAHGRIGAPSGSDAKLSFAVSGILSRIDVRIGDAVREGQVLAACAGADIAASLSLAANAKVEAARARLLAIEHGRGPVESEKIAVRTALAQSEAKMTFDERTLTREQELYRGGVAARKDVEAASAQLVFDRAEEQANRAKLQVSSVSVGDASAQARAEYAAGVSEADIAVRNVENTALRSPSDGVVVAIFKHVGESLDPTTPVIEIGSPAGKILTLTIPGSVVQRVRAGDPIDFTMTARGVHGRGHIVGIVPSIDPLTQTATVTADGIPQGVLNGEAVNATIDIGRAHGILVPVEAVVQDPQTGQPLVFVRMHRENGSFGFSSRVVILKEEDDQYALIGSGLHAGEIVATQGAFDLLAPSGLPIIHRPAYASFRLSVFLAFWRVETGFWCPLRCLAVINSDKSCT